MRISEPAADLAVAAALISSLTGMPLPADMVVFGEISLSGEVRSVGQSDARLKEAAKLGFRSALVPAGRKGAKMMRSELELKETTELRDMVEFFERTSDTPIRVLGGS